MNKCFGNLPHCECRVIFLRLIAVLILTASAFGQAAPTAKESPVVMRTLFIADAVATSADFAFTHRLSTEPVWHENDPLARPFVTHGTPLQVAFFAAKFAVFETTAWQLRKHHHTKLAASVQAFSIGLSTDGAWHSAFGYNTIKK